ncbi:MAG: hypothetical protein ABFC94_10035 [Syntrophomonas sp.]
MLIKKLCLVIIFIAAYTYIMVNYPSDFIKSLGYNNLLDLYASQVSSRSDFNIIYNPGLRKCNIILGNIKTQSVIPGDYNNYGEEMQRFIIGDKQAIIECSGLDAWHTSKTGAKYLAQIRDKGYRVVVFDGGHHLPTLGLSPDLIIVPEMAGYAVHAYMLDGIKVDVIKQMAADIKSPSVIVTVPRWALVKSDASLNNMTRRVFKECYYRNDVNESFKPICTSGMSKNNGVVFAYINRQDINSIMSNCRELGLKDVRKIYVAFNYNYFSEPGAEQFRESMQESLGLPVLRVNEPVKTFNVLFR